MTNDEINIIRTEIRTIKEIDALSALQEALGNNVTESTLVSGNLTIGIFLAYHRKMISEFIRELSTDSMRFYDRYCYVSNTSVDIVGLLQAYRNYLRTSNLSYIELNLTQIVQYAMHWGFWEKGTKKEHPFDKNKLNEYQSRSIILNNELERIISEVKSLQGKLIKEKGDLTIFIDSKEEDYSQKLANIESKFSTLESNVSTAQNHFNQITKYLADSQAAFTKITNIINFSQTAQENFSESLIEQEKQFQEWKREYTELRIETTNLAEDHKNQSGNLTEKLKEATKLLEDINKDEKKVLELIGLATGASLFDKFNHRRKDIEGTIKWWLMGSFASFVLLIYGLWFGWDSGILIRDFTLEAIGGNLLRATPLALPLYFCLRQYSKERTYLEEYAFKSSIAVTLEAFRKLLSHDESGQSTLIYAATKEIFNSPKGMRDNQPLLKLNSKDVSASLKEILEAIKGLTPK